MFKVGKPPFILYLLSQPVHCINDPPHPPPPCSPKRTLNGQYMYTGINRPLLASCINILIEFYVCVPVFLLFPMKTYCYVCSSVPTLFYNNRMLCMFQCSYSFLWKQNVMYVPVFLLFPMKTECNVCSSVPALSYENKMLCMFQCSYSFLWKLNFMSVSVFLLLPMIT